ncbi:MAG: hypothetical protein NZ853_07660 [Leptospiraceae bacterium]|nr:hypothetical protein [Leptospiraceae bacterium]MDW7975689.1 hypothetical protein [Leptospiraceae bacterium]
MDYMITELNEFEVTLKQDIARNYKNLSFDYDNFITKMKKDIENIINDALSTDEIKIHLALQYNILKSKWIILNNRIQSHNLRYGTVHEELVMKAYIMSQFIGFIEKYLELTQKKSIDTFLSNYNEILNASLFLVTLNHNDLIIEPKEIKIFEPKKVVIKKRNKQRS